MPSLDRAALASVLLLLAVGIAFQASMTLLADPTPAATRLFYRHLAFAALAVAALLVAARLDYHAYYDWAAAFFVLSVVLLLATPFGGQSIRGARRWLAFGPISIQPVVIGHLALAFYLCRQIQRASSGGRRWFAVSLFVPVFFQVAIVFLQPDASSAILLLLWAALFIGATTGFRLGLLALASLLPLASILLLGAGYRRARLLSFLAPGADPVGLGFQVSQSMIALGSGGWGGAGFGNGVMKHDFVPDMNSTFVLAIVGEEAGFIGVCLILALFVFLLWFGVDTARRARDRAGELLAVAVTIWILLQALLNMSSVSGLAPVVGLPLPFISTGGTWLIGACFGAGILLNVRRSCAAARAAPSGTLVAAQTATHRRDDDFGIGVRRLADRVERHPLFLLLMLVSSLLTTVVGIVEIGRWIWPGQR